MGHPFSVVIVCKNEADIIGKTLEKLVPLSNDILVYDTGSTDDTLRIVSAFPVRLHRGEWEGFGKTKARALGMSRYDWVLFLDADEVPDDELQQSLQNWMPDDENTAYLVAFKNYFLNKPLRFGEWGSDQHIRLFHKGKIRWDESPVHEKLLLPPEIKYKKLNGAIHHFTVKSIEHYKTKLELYARLGAEKYFLQGRKSNSIKRKLGPVFSFLQHYVFKLGWLDGRAGFQCARLSAWYTKLKYRYLNELSKQKRKNEKKN
ncbi:MAG: glycosyltransferase family 2 protein [Chitinophagaceae bacterium]|nr:glycosyltransferase family 2 protein [Chitinophagaceae bacterium]